jgi:hypothetical protein
MTAYQTAKTTHDGRAQRWSTTHAHLESGFVAASKGPS